MPTLKELLDEPLETQPIKHAPADHMKDHMKGMETLLKILIVAVEKNTEALKNPPPREVTISKDKSGRIDSATVTTRGAE